jgi:hypothetical protein
MLQLILVKLSRMSFSHINLYETRDGSGVTAFKIAIGLCVSQQLLDSVPWRAMVRDD